jgi:5'-methylthioadenosine phosphorylase
MKGAVFAGESHWYRSMGATSSMTMPETRLARSPIAYATLGMVTDYDCWRPSGEHVTAEMAIANLMKNAARAQTIVVSAVRYLAERAPVCAAHSALASGL